MYSSIQKGATDKPRTANKHINKLTSVHRRALSPSSNDPNKQASFMGGERRNGISLEQIGHKGRTISKDKLLEN